MPISNAGNNRTVFVGEAIRLDGTASSGYATESQADGTWSTLWQTGDGYDAENVIKCPHVYTKAGVYTATLTVKDASGVAAVSSIQVTAQDIPAADVGNTVTLTDTGNAADNRTNLQAAIDTAAASSATREIRVPAGFVFNDPISLPARTSTNYVTIRLADLSVLPERVRVTANDKSKLFRMNMRGFSVTGAGNGVEMAFGAQYYRVIGLEIRKTASDANCDMIGSAYVNDVGDQNYIIFDRCLLDGNEFETRKAVVMNTKSMSLIHSSILNIKAIGVETKAIANWNGSGPLAVVNCRLECASINVLIGGSPAPLERILDGFVFRGNYCWKDPAWVGRSYTMKNLWELKHGYNSVAVGNIFENNYSDAQAGEAILIKSNTDSGCAACEVSRVDFRSNKILNVRAGFNVINMQAFNPPNPPYANHIRFVNNFWQQVSGRGNQSQGADYFEIIHNTFTTTDEPQEFPVSSFLTLAAGSSGVPGSYRAPGYKVLNNLVYDAFYGNSSIVGDGTNGTNTLNAFVGSDWEFRKNVIGNVNASSHPADNFYPASVKPDYVNYAGGDFHLKSTSPYKGAATDGKDIGADLSELSAWTASAVSGDWYVGATPPPPPPVLPVAEFAKSPSSGVAPLTVQFTDKSTNTPVSWLWKFGDGTADSTAQNPSHVFAAAGSYTVLLTATDAQNVSKTASQVVTVSAAPVADTTLPVVGSFVATAVSQTQINLAYNATDNVGVTGYDLDWSPNGSTDWTPLIINALPASPFQHTGRTASTTYYYRFRARDAAGNISAYSTANATTSAAPPPPPANTSNKIVYTWADGLVTP